MSFCIEHPFAICKNIYMYLCHDAIGCEITFNDDTGGDSTVLISLRPFHLIYKISWDFDHYHDLCKNCLPFRSPRVHSGFFMGSMLPILNFLFVYVDTCLFLSFYFIFCHVFVILYYFTILLSSVGVFRYSYNIMSFLSYSI